MKSLDLYHLISAQDTFEGTAKVYGHDVDFQVRNIKEIREAINPAPLIRFGIALTDRISLVDIEMDIQAMSEVDGVRTPVSSRKLHKCLGNVAMLLSDYISHALAHSTNGMYAGTTFELLGVEMLLTSYVQQYNTDTIRMTARPTMRDF